MVIMTDGPLLEPDNKDISEFHVGLGSRLGASATATWEDSPVHQLAGIAELEQAGGAWPDYGEIASGFPTGPQIADATKPAAARMDIIEANDRVKKAGLSPHLKLPDQPDIAPAQLAIMMDRARRRHELDTTIERGPQGFIPGALDVGTSFLVGAADPLNLASAFVPVMGELRYGKLLADAGASALSRASVRAGVGAAQGVAGQALLEPLDWYSHTQDGRDFGMADVLHNLLFGAVLGGGLQAGGGAIADVWRGRKGRPLYPYGPGEPLEAVPQRVPLGPELAPEAHAAAAAEPPFDVARTTVDINGERTVIDTDLAAVRADWERRAEQLERDFPSAPSPEVQTINDLPARAHEDAMRGAISDLVNGVPVRAGEMLEAAAKTDPRIAESFDVHSRNAQISASGARAAVADDVRQKLLDAGMAPAEADANAAIVAARYAARADRLGGTHNAVELYRGENISIGQGEDSPEGRAFHQSQPQAPAFYSAVDRAITAAGQDKATPEQWLGTLKNAAGVKAEELKWLGLEDWLKEQQGPVSKSQLQDYVRANAIEVKEVEKGKARNAEAETAESAAWHDLRDAGVPNGRSVDLMGMAFRDELVAEDMAGLSDRVKETMLDLQQTYRGMDQRLPPKYETYVLPGGENYRELLLTLPPTKVKHDSWSVLRPDGHIESTWANPAAAAKWAEKIGGTVKQNETINLDGGFRSSHWDEPNVLAHIRFDDRISDGKKTLHLAEVQSDWHQAGKRRGYDSKPNLTEDARAALVAERDEIVAGAMAAKNEIDAKYGAEFERRGLRNASQADKVAFWAPLHDELAKDPREIRYSERINDLSAALGEHQGGVPDAPFKTTWPELSMKRMIRYAAEHGYDRISWDTGATNAERYDLSKRISEVRWNSRTRDIQAVDHGGTVVLHELSVAPEKLEGIIGKDAAEKLVSSPTKTYEGAGDKYHILSGLDLKVGGEGMAGFYDRILPATVNKLVKKFGAKVEEASIEPGPQRHLFVYEAQDHHGRAVYEVRDRTTGEPQDAFATKSEAQRFVDRESKQAEPAKVHSVDLIPELRKAAMEHGFPLFQGGAESPRGRITLSDNKAIIDLYQSADASTFMHESGHLWLDELMRDAAHRDAPQGLKADRDTVLAWLGVKDASEIKTAQHEQWAEGFEQYLKTGEAPSIALAKAFAQFKQWLGEIYRGLARSGAEIGPEIKGVMDRLLATGAEIADRADELGASTRAVSKARPAGRAGADPQTWSLFEFLAHEGGLKPDPELKAIFGSERSPFVPGFGSLIRKDGLALDEALTRAKEQHYMADPHDAGNGQAGSHGRTSLGLIPRDLLDLIDRENRRERQYRLDRTAPEETVDRVEEARHIVAALHDDLEAGGGQAIEIDPKLESRVVEIVQKEGGTDVLAAYERAIMEDAERYEGLSDARRQIEATRHLPGWDVAESSAAPGNGAADPGRHGQARVSAGAAGAGDGGQPRGAGAGDRGAGAAQLDRDAAWKTLAHTTPDFDAPEIVAASKAADEVPKPPSKLAERVTASEKADAFAKQMYDMFAHRLPEQDRVRLDDLIKRIDDDHEAREIAIVRGGSCLFGVA